MTTTLLRRLDPVIDHGTAPRRRDRWTVPALAAICAVSVALSLRPGTNANPFQDEGLYLFMGHRMIDHVRTGAHLAEYPGTFFSGAPGVYPVLAALADSAGGVLGARLLSAAFVCVAIVAVCGVGTRLYGSVAGVSGAAAFALCGSVIFVSHLATFDAMAMAVVASALWLAVRSAQEDAFLFAPLVGVLLALAFFVKYATAVYAPGVAMIGALLVCSRIGWGAMTRAVVVVTTGVAVVFFVVIFAAQDLTVGIMSTTAERVPISPAPPEQMLADIGRWVGIWLVLAALGAVVQFRRWPLSVLLLLFSVIGPLQQLRIGESTSLAKHVGFGLVFAAPLIGALIAGVWGVSRWIGVPFVAVILASLLHSGMATSKEFATGWIDDTVLVSELRTAMPTIEGRTILGEEPSAQRYALRDVTEPEQWTDTFELLYGGKTGIAAYREAIDQSHFGVVYLTLTTPNGKAINDYLTAEDTPYRLSAKVPFTRHGEFLGYFLVWTPEAVG